MLIAAAAVTLALVALRAVLCAVALLVERASLPELAPGEGPPLSIVIPLYGWDERFLELLPDLRRAGEAYGSPVDVVAVVDEDHPRRRAVDAAAASAGARVIAPGPADGKADKVRRLRAGVRAARHAHVMLLDSDVVVDDDFLLRRAAAHVADPALRLSFALPAYRDAAAVGDRVLGAFTLHHNLALFFLGWWLFRGGTSIGPSQLVRNDDGALAPMLDALKDSFADDHALGRAVELRGESVRAVPMEVVVHASDPSLRATSAQVLRWMVTAKHALPSMTMLSLAWAALSTTLSSAGPVLLAGGLLSGASAAAAIGVAVLALEAVAQVALEALLFRRPPRRRALCAVPAFMLVVPLLFAVSLGAGGLRWRGRRVA